MSKESWEIAAAELKCNKTQGYHCVPNTNYTSLIQFCYPGGYRIPVQKGILKFPGFLFCCVFPGYIYIHLNNNTFSSHDLKAQLSYSGHILSVVRLSNRSVRL